MLSKDKIITLVEQQGKITTASLTTKFSVSRQYANRLLASLVAENKLIKIGSTRSSYYVSIHYFEQHPEILQPRYVTTLKNISLEEHKILQTIAETFPNYKKLPENIGSIFHYAFSEMLNNAIEHSQSKTIHIEVFIHNKIFSFIIADSGIGVFKNIMQKRKLKSELEAIQDLLKGKTSTMPKSHSGEGIFFTSKVCDRFVLDSYGYQLIIDNTLPDIFVRKVNKRIKGTKVIFDLSINSKLHLNDIFNKYTNLDEESDYGFDKTEICVKLYTIAGIHISRSQARRILVGLEKFKIILFDFDKVPMVGQAFADEIFRVFHNKHPHIKLETTNMNEGVKFMIERAKNIAKANSNED